jgi:hypothetical protein
VRASLLEMDDVFAGFAGLSRALKEIWDKIYLNALQMFEIIYNHIRKQDRKDSLT